jgi:hypothetical protein
MHVCWYVTMYKYYNSWALNDKVLTNKMNKLEISFTLALEEHILSFKWLPVPCVGTERNTRITLLYLQDKWGAAVILLLVAWHD